MPGAMPLFKAFGITVFLHWTWFLVLLYMPRINAQVGFADDTAGYLWTAGVLVGLFAIVTLHEFGHALACLSVKGKADTIILLPIGGVALVQPPMRPWPVLWSLAAGPLVNVVLLPILGGLYLALRYFGDAVPTDVMKLLVALNGINIMLLIFNMMPVYPLDGGQILQGFLWLLIGRSKSLMVAASIGMVVSGGIGILALIQMDIFLVLIAAFLLWQGWRGFQYARLIAADPEGVARAEEAMLRGEDMQSYDPNEQNAHGHPGYGSDRPPYDQPPYAAGQQGDRSMQTPAEWGPRNEAGEPLDSRATGPVTRHDTKLIREMEDGEQADEPADEGDESQPRNDDGRYR